jgi:citrate lyase beta subunit
MDFRNSQILERECLDGKALGFTGKVEWLLIVYASIF